MQFQNPVCFKNGCPSKWGQKPVLLWHFCQSLNIYTHYPKGQVSLFVGSNKHNLSVWGSLSIQRLRSNKYGVCRLSTSKKSLLIQLLQFIHQFRLKLHYYSFNSPKWPLFHDKVGKKINE